MITMWNLENFFGYIFSLRHEWLSWKRYRNFTIKKYASSPIRYIRLKEFRKEFETLFIKDLLFISDLNKDLLYTKDNLNKFSHNIIILNGVPCIITSFGFSDAGYLIDYAILQILEDKLISKK